MNQEIRKKKKDPQLLKDLRSPDDVLVLKTLHKLRSAGHLAYIPDLLKLLSQTKSELIEKELIIFLADIKEKSVVPIIVAGLTQPGIKVAHAGILSAIWQSGLDYSRYLDLFIQLFIEGDYLVALESFSVIEQSLVHLNVQKIEEDRKILLEGLEQITENKKPLARELLNLMQI